MILIKLYGDICITLDNPENYFLLFLDENIYCGYSLEAPQVLLMSTHNIFFYQEVRKYQNVLVENAFYLVL